MATKGLMPCNFFPKNVTLCVDFFSLKVLWGSWCVLGPWHKFYFAGDTGYCHAFEQIGNRFGPFDLAAIPIGSYEPR